jgi:predicted nuclease of predicted toxin-antitoxin system
MKLLLDEMYNGLKEYFEVLGCQVKTVKEVDLSGKKDREIAEYAKKHGLILVTEDHKSAELAELMGGLFFYVDSKTKAKMIYDSIIEKYGE